MDLHVLPQGTGVRVGLVAASHFAVVGLVARVHVGMLLPVAAVGEAPLAAFELALEGLLSCKERSTPGGLCLVDRSVRWHLGGGAGPFPPVTSSTMLEIGQADSPSSLPSTYPGGHVSPLAVCRSGTPRQTENKRLQQM